MARVTQMVEELENNFEELSEKFEELERDMIVVREDRDAYEAEAGDEYKRAERLAAEVDRLEAELELRGRK